MSLFLFWSAWKESKSIPNPQTYKTFALFFSPPIKSDAFWAKSLTKFTESMFFMVWTIVEILWQKLSENTTCPTSRFSPGRELVAPVVSYCIWNVLLLPRAALWMCLWFISPFRWSVKDTKCKQLEFKMSKINEVIAYFPPFENPCAAGQFKGIFCDPQDK